MATPAIHDHSSAQQNPLELETLQLLPCGCVTSIRRVRSWEFYVVSIEAKGPHCRLSAHRLGRVAFSRIDELVGDEDEPIAG